MNANRFEKNIPYPVALSSGQY